MIFYDDLLTHSMGEQTTKKKQGSKKTTTTTKKNTEDQGLLLAMYVPGHIHITKKNGGASHIISRSPRYGDVSQR